MYRFSKEPGTVSSDESLESALKRSIKVNPIDIVLNPFRKNDSKKIMAIQSVKRPKSSHKPGKGKLIRSSMRTIKMDLENKVKSKEESKPKVVKKKTTTLDFIQRLREIEKSVDKDSFLDQTNDEIDIASKQLEELQKLLMLKMHNVENGKKRKTKEDRKSSSQHLLESKLNRQLERMQKQYLNKTRVQYRSLKDVENLTVSTDLPEEDAETRVEDSKMKIYWTKNKVQKPRNRSNKQEVKHTQTQTRYHFKNACSASQLSSEEVEEKKLSPKEPFQRALPTSSNKKSPISERLSRFSSRFANRRTSSLLKVKLPDITEYVSSSEEEKMGETSSSEVEYCDDLNLTSHIFSTRKFKENRIRQQDDDVEDNLLEEDSNAVSRLETSGPEGESSCKEASQVSENGEESPSNDSLDLDIMLEESILKSAYLSREFSIDFTNKLPKVDKAAQKRSVQLLETTQRKFQDPQTCRLTNLKRRDQKLYTSLNTALKDTLYGEIRE